MIPYLDLQKINARFKVGFKTWFDAISTKRAVYSGFRRLLILKKNLPRIAVSRSVWAWAMVLTRSA